MAIKTDIKYNDVILDSIASTGSINYDTAGKYFANDLTIEFTGPDDATATSADILAGQTAYIADGSKATGTISTYSWTAMTLPNKPTNLAPSAQCTGSEITNGYTCPTGVTMTGNDRGTNPGTYTAVYTPSTGYCWSDLTTESVTIVLTITVAKRFVTVGTKKAYYSTDHATWTEMTGLDGTTSCIAVTYGNGRFVCVGGSGKSYYSTNGTTWTEMSGLDSDYYYAVTYGNGRFVCVGGSSKSYYSTDGETWTAMTGLPTGTVCLGVTYGNSRFICIGYTRSGPTMKNATYCSTDGETWTAMTGVSGKTTVQGVAYGNNKFVCVGGGAGNGYAYYSTDGDTWTAMTGLDTTLQYNAVTYGNDRFVCVGQGGLSYYSTDGETWTAMSGLVDAPYEGVGYGDNKFVAVGNMGYTNCSVNGTSWSSTISGTTEGLTGIAYGEL